MPVNTKAVANYFIKRAKEKGEKLTNMKLQKLVYFAHGWHLAATGEPLLDETVEAWDYGPVVRTLYHEFKEFGSGRITREARPDWYEEPQDVQMPDTEAGQRAVKVIDRIWDVYGKFDGGALSDMTHQPGSPWYDAAAEYDFKPPKGLDIPNDKIRRYFESQARRTAGR